MSTIKSSAEDLTLNADGSNEVKFQINAVEKASINSSGLFTSTTIDATALTGNLPAISGASLTGITTGKVLQVVNSSDSTLVTGTTTLPYDNTIPQITEGNELLTVAITPASTSNYLYIIAMVQGTSSVEGRWQMALFQDSTANALATAMINSDTTNGGDMDQCQLFHYMSAGTVSATTFRIRAGTNSASTIRMNGTASIQYGTTMASSLTVMEISA